MTAAELKAIQAVADGRIQRIYRRNGNSFRSIHGVGAAVLWRLLQTGLIEDGEDFGGVYSTTVEMQLTDAGHLALANLEPPP